MYRTLLPRRALASVALMALVAGCSGGGSTSPRPPVQSTPGAPVPPVGGGNGTGNTGTTSGAAYTCSSSDAATSARERASTGTVHRGVQRNAAAPSASTGLIGVTYSRTLGASAISLAVARERLANASFVRDMTFSKIGRYERILHVTPGTEAQAIATLRAQPGVIGAAMTGTRRSLETVASQYYPNDPFYNGFDEAQILTAGDTGNATFHVDPYEESASVPGQWGDHAIGLPFAQAYSQPGNGSGIVNAGALGSSGVKIAIIDSGEDSTHPELASKIAYQRCFITSTTGQSTSDFSVDEDGHGTDVSGIAAAASNNGLGFAGSGGAATIYAYRVFPTPDDNCTPGNLKSGTDNQCGASTADIGDAIVDAVNNKVDVISLSLGGGGCSNGTDEDPTEGNAIAMAIAAGIVVVAAAGNDNGTTGSTGSVAAPACDTGVIAVGASALDDGATTGTSTAPVGSATTPIEYVAGYSQYGTPGVAVDSSTAWGIVAPGGDPSDADADPNATSTDELHWIENIWTTTPFQSSSTDTSFEGDCSPDFGSPGGTTDCRVLIAGTSQATPLVAGAAASIIAANPAYKSPAMMKQLLCSTAHDIGSAFEGCGRLDLYRAMATAVGDPSPPASQ